MFTSGSTTEVSLGYLASFHSVFAVCRYLSRCFRYCSQPFGPLVLYLNVYCNAQTRSPLAVFYTRSFTYLLSYAASPPRLIAGGDLCTLTAYTGTQEGEFLSSDLDRRYLFAPHPPPRLTLSACLQPIVDQSLSTSLSITLSCGMLIYPTPSIPKPHPVSIPKP